jgi:glycosyltransferase involved in cell wall biosynthesis
MIEPIGPTARVPRLLVFCSLFPHASAPAAGLFVRERAFRLARVFPLVVVAPQPWSPVDALVRWFRPSFRPMGPRFEVVEGVEVHRPRVLSVPGVLKGFDSPLMALCAARTVRRIVAAFRPTAIDAHFLYPDGHAAVRLGRRFDLPVYVTVRGSKDARLVGGRRDPALREVIRDAHRLIAVSASLRDQVCVPLGASRDHVAVVGNGVDLRRFAPVDRQIARERLGLPPDAPVMIGVGGLTPNKGFDRVITMLPALRRRLPGLRYLIVGGGTSSGDQRAELEALARRLGVDEAVVFCGRRAPDELKWYYGAADVFVLATAYEGWANVFLEAMACGLPVVTTDVGGNREVVGDAGLGAIVPVDDDAAFEAAVEHALRARWDHDAIVAHARANDWDRRIATLAALFREPPSAGTS